MYIWRNIVARSHKHFCCGKATTLHIRSLCLCPCFSYPTCKAHAPFYIICGLSACAIFFFLSHLQWDNQKRKLSEISLILRIIHRDTIKNGNMYGTRDVCITFRVAESGFGSRWKKFGPYSKGVPPKNRYTKSEDLTLICGSVEWLWLRLKGLICTIGKEQY
jgi:hypothetical protein